MALQRLDKILAGTGLFTRSEAAAAIRRGIVTIDGKPAVSGAEKFDPDGSEILVNGQLLEFKRYIYLMVNKPAGYVSATRDRKEMAVTGLLESRLQKLGLFPAGRLDKDAVGLLLLTNDGDYAHKIMSPAKKIWKTYYIETDCPFESGDTARFAGGLKLADGTACLPARLDLSPGGSGAYVTVCEGKYHQVKRMAASVGKRVLFLERVSIGGLVLDRDLKRGEYRELTDAEVQLCLETASW